MSDLSLVGPTQLLDCKIHFLPTTIKPWVGCTCYYTSMTMTSSWRQPHSSLAITLRWKGFPNANPGSKALIWVSWWRHRAKFGYKVKSRRRGVNERLSVVSWCNCVNWWWNWNWGLNTHIVHSSTNSFSSSSSIRNKKLTNRWSKFRSNFGLSSKVILSRESINKQKRAIQAKKLVSV